MVGALLALLSAATFGLNNAGVRRGVLTGTVLQAMALSVPLGAPIFLLACAALGSFGSLRSFSPQVLGFFAAAGIVHFVFGRYCNYRALRAMGAVLTGPVQQTSLLVALLLAVLVLHEQLTVLKLTGVALVVAGPAVILSATKRNKKRKATIGVAKPALDPDFKPKYVEGYVFAGLSALGYGVSPALVRFGLTTDGVKAGAAAGLVSYVAATVAFLPVFIAPGRMRDVVGVSAASAKWFAFSGVLAAVSQLFRYMALSLAPVTVVSPIQRLSVLFRVYFSVALNPKHEELTRVVIAGTALSLLGALVLTVGPAILAAVPLPDVLHRLADWRIL